MSKISDRDPIEHEIGCEPDTFRACVARSLKAGIFDSGLGIRVGDSIRIVECFKQEFPVPLGSWAVFRVTYVTSNFIGLAEGFVFASFDGPLASKIVEPSLP